MDKWVNISVQNPASVASVRSLFMEPPTSPSLLGDPDPQGTALSFNPSLSGMCVRVCVYGCVWLCVFVCVCGWGGSQCPPRCNSPDGPPWACSEVFLPHGDDGVSWHFPSQGTVGHSPSVSWSLFLCCLRFSLLLLWCPQGWGRTREPLVPGPSLHFCKWEVGTLSFLYPLTCDFQGTLCLKWHFLSQMWAKSGGRYTISEPRASVLKREGGWSRNGCAVLARLGWLWGPEQKLRVGSSSFHTPGESTLSDGDLGSAGGWGTEKVAQE